MGKHLFIHSRQVVLPEGPPPAPPHQGGEPGEGQQGEGGRLGLEGRPVGTVSQNGILTGVLKEVQTQEVSFYVTEIQKNQLAKVFSNGELLFRFRFLLILVYFGNIERYYMSLNLFKPNGHIAFLGTLCWRGVRQAPEAGARGAGRR